MRTLRHVYVKSINRLIVFQTRLKLKIMCIHRVNREKMQDFCNKRNRTTIMNESGRLSKIPLRDNNTAHQRCKSGHYFHITSTSGSRKSSDPSKPQKKMQIEKESPQFRSPNCSSAL